MGDDACNWFGERCSGAQVVSAVKERGGVFVTFWSAHHNSDMYCWGVDIDGENGGEKVRMRVLKMQTLWYFCPLSPAMAVAMVGGLCCTVIPKHQTWGWGQGIFPLFFC